MASTRQLKSRIRSVKSNRQITKAMELVAASKLRRAQEATVASRLYADSARELLTHLSGLDDVRDHPLYVQREVKNRLIILITSDRGLAGAYNSNVIKRAMAIIKEDRSNNVHTSIICMGKKGASFASKVKDLDVVGTYDGLPEQPTADDIRPILRSALTAFREDVQAVDVVTTKFVNSITQTALSTPMLPAGFDKSEVTSDVSQSAFEPSVSRVLESATERLLEAQLYQAFLDAKASEHSMRRAAMKNASDNAGEIVDDLTLEMNKVRQAGITQELAEISGGVEAMK